MLFTLVSPGENWPWDRRRVIFPFERERASVLYSMPGNRTRTARIKLHRSNVLLNAVPQLVPQQARLTDRTPCFLILQSSYYSILHSVKLHRLHLCPHFTIFVLVVVSVLMLLTMCRHTTHTTGKSSTCPCASARAADAKLIHDLMTHINPLN